MTDQQHLARRGAPLVLLALASLLSAPTWATRVQVDTRLGSFQIELYDDVAPNTVANFLDYVESGAYDGTFFHRAISGFVIQGGGFAFDGEAPVAIEANDPVANEFGRSNVRGTVAMAKLDGDPDSATSQWFVNLRDNSERLDSLNGGFTVFGEVVGDGMRVVDSIVAQAGIWPFPGAFSDLPLIDYPGNVPVTDEFLITTDITVVPETGFAINPGVAGSWFNEATSGQGWFVDVIEDVDGSLQLFVAWFTYDDSAPPANEDLSFGSSHHRWFTAIGPVDGNTAEMDLFRNAGGRFNHPRSAPIERVGSLTMRFDSCTEAELEYVFETGTGGSGTIEAIRLSPDVFCEAAAVR